MERGSKTKSKSSWENTNIPAGIKIISVLYYISAALRVSFGLAFFLFSFIVGRDISGVGANIATGVFIMMGIILIGPGVLAFFVGKGLWNTRPWARITAIVLSGLGSLIALISIMQGDIFNFITLVISFVHFLPIVLGDAGNIIILLVHLAIGGYLLFSKEVKEAFS